MKRMRTVSNVRHPAAEPPISAVWKNQGVRSAGMLGRRVARIACSAESISVSTKSLLNAGCAESVAGGQSTISA